MAYLHCSRAGFTKQNPVTALSKIYPLVLQTWQLIGATESPGGSHLFILSEKNEAIISNHMYIITDKYVCFII